MCRQYCCGYLQEDQSALSFPVSSEEEISFIFQKHEGLGCYVASYLSVFGRVDVGLVSLDIAVAVRIAEQSQFVFCLEDAAAGCVDVFLRHLAISHALARCLTKALEHISIPYQPGVPVLMLLSDPWQCRGSESR